jgi:hypothetical protein
MCIAASILAFPFYSLALLTTDNFWLSMVGIAGYYINGIYKSPNFTMMQKSIDPQKQGEIISGFQLYTILAGTGATIIVGWLINYL